VDYSKLNDETLIKLIAHAQADALSELYNRYNRLVFSLAFNIVGERNSAEEITLDVFTRVWERAETYRAERAQVNTWLMSITRYRAIDVLRQVKIRLETNSANWAELPTDRVPHVIGSEESVELTMQREKVRAALAQLPLNQKEVLALAYFKGYTHRQIAEVLDQPLGTVKTRIRLAIQKLRQILHEEQVGLD
jgi:RNA polymerase sigma-70 factor (ECF subfamily)